METELTATGGMLGRPSGDHVGHRIGVDVDVAPQLTDRNRLTCAFRMILALPHIVLVGGPAALAVSLGWHTNGEPQLEWGSGSGIFGAGAAISAVIAWFAIVVGGRYPAGLRDLTAFYLRWRVRSVAYLTLLRDEYPPFGDGAYPATLTLEASEGPRNRLSVAFRIFLALPQITAVSLLGIAWAMTTLVAWVSILFTGNFPEPLYHFGVGVLRWSTRVEAYLLLLRDEYPPFSFE